jgi:DNA-binding CsgD family transcriptional regulator
MSVPEIASRLARTADFVAAAGVVCRATRELLGVHQTCISLHAPSGQPLVGVDDMPRIADELRVAYFHGMWREDPYLAAVRAHQVGLETIDAAELIQISRGFGYTGDELHGCFVPLLEPAGVLGMARFGNVAPVGDDLRRRLVAITTHLSVHLARLDITNAESDLLARLTNRQREVAALAARGCTNIEIAELLEMSENTVKKHLKDIYERAGVDSRTELANRLARRGPRDAIVAAARGETGDEAAAEVSVERDGELAITRLVR